MKKNKDLDVMIPDYFSANSSAKSFKKTADDLNSQIKAIMRKAYEKSEDDNSYEAGEYVATYSMQDRSSMNEDALLEYLKKNVSKEQLKQTKLIKKREYVDGDVLEDLIYNEKLDKEIIVGMESCKVPSSVEVLRVTKKKKEKK